jgi:hypothetical protein
MCDDPCLGCRYAEEIRGGHYCHKQRAYHTAPQHEGTWCSARRELGDEEEPFASPVIRPNLALQGTYPWPSPAALRRVLGIVLLAVTGASILLGILLSVCRGAP